MLDVHRLQWQPTRQRTPATADKGTPRHRRCYALRAQGTTAKVRTRRQQTKRVKVLCGRFQKPRSNECVADLQTSTTDANHAKRQSRSLRERIRAARLSSFEAKLRLPSTCSPRASIGPLERMLRFSPSDLLPSEVALGQRQEAGEAEHEGREQEARLGTAAASRRRGRRQRAGL